MNTAALRIGALAAALGTPAACSDVTGGAGGAVRLTADTTYIPIEGSVQLRTEGASGIRWSSTDEAVATVDGSGKVTGKHVGTVGIVGAAKGAADTLQLHVTPSPRRAIATGTHFACVLDVDGKAYCWGANEAGQLGNGGSANSPSPVAVMGGLTFDMIEAGGRTACGITPSGEAHCWGAGTLGQLGNGGNLHSVAPAKVLAPQPLKAISVGGYDVACALGMDGTPYCWGANIAGTVGDGTKAIARVPTAVSTSLKFTSITAGLVQSCALTAEGAAYCWGRNSLFSLGIGNQPASAERLTPVAAYPELRFASLEAGVTTCGVTLGAGGTYCWGINYVGSMSLGHQGQADREGLIAPVRIVEPQPFAQVAVGEENDVFTPNCMLTAAGKAYCAGANSQGQLGLAGLERCEYFSLNFECSGTPLPIDGGLAFEKVDPSSEFACGLTLDGRAYCWGTNVRGQIGPTVPASTSSPTRVAAQLRLP